MRKTLLFVFAVVLSISANAQSWTGLHYKTQDLDLWLKRTLLDPSGTGKFRVKGDVSTNSPGDWTRIKANADAFVTNPATDRYSNYYKGSGAWPKSLDGSTDGKGGWRLRDAAFAGMLFRYGGQKLSNSSYVTQGNTYLSKVRTELLGIVRQKYKPSTGDSLRAFDWNDRVRFPLNQWGDINPGFTIAEWMARLVYAYDYSKEIAGYSAAEKAEIETWFRDGATLLLSNSTQATTGLGSCFVNRLAGNYTLSSGLLSEEVNDEKNVTSYKPRYFGGPYARKLARIYNNRRNQLEFLAGIVGVLINNQALINEGKNFYKELTMFGLNQEGTYGDWQRGIDYATAGGNNAGPDVGWGYSFAMMNSHAALADVFARRGDFSLFTFKTRAGTTQAESKGDFTAVLNPARQDKSLLTAILFHDSCRVGYKKVYATANSANVGNFNYRIDGQNGTWRFNKDMGLAVANMYYKNAFVKQVYLRQIPLQNAGTANQTGSIPFDSAPAQDADTPPYSDIAQYPGVMLMFADRETADNPYQAQTVLTPQTISFPQPQDRTFGDAPFALTVSAASGLPVSLTVVSGPATLSGSTVTITGVGTVTIKASQAGNGTYAAAPDVQRSFVVNRASNTISFGTLPDVQLGGVAFTKLTATATSALPVRFATSSPIARISNDTLFYLGVGRVTVTASQEGNSNYLPASPVQQSFQINPDPIPSRTNPLIGAVVSTYYEIQYDEDGGATDVFLYEWSLPGSNGWDFSKGRFTVVSLFANPRNSVTGVLQGYNGSTWLDLGDVIGGKTYTVSISETATLYKLRIRSRGKNNERRIQLASAAAVPY